MRGTAIALCFALALSSGSAGLPLTAVRAQTFCMSDEELTSVLIDVHMFALGQLTDTCVGRFPDISRRAIRFTQQLEKTYSAELAANDRLSLEPFERAYPGRGREMRDRNTYDATEPSRKAAEQYSRDECESILSALEATIVANDWKLATLPAQIFFRQERALTPACR